MRQRVVTAAAVLLGLPMLLPALPQQGTTAVQAEIVIALDVENREPVGGSQEFPADVGQLVAWTKVTGAAGTTIEHVWRYRERERVVPLGIGGSPWRVWSRKNIPSSWTGEWTLEVRDSGGKVIASTTFRVGEE